ncbi:MAG: hypothetical protein HC897_17540 [Thermoanaerobaculia bacterium]|nr:hypothetical protein [Thermoanaerobaculia bacterium]
MARPALAPLPRLFAVCLLLLSIAPAAWAGVSPPTFGKAFSSSTIGPGAVSTLTFTINNPNVGQLATDLAFTDVLPAGVAIADPSSATTTCIDAVVVAPAGGSTISLSGGSLPGLGACTVRVNVTSAVVGTHSNLSGDLTSSLGNSGPAAADLTIAANYPGFSKSFARRASGSAGAAR